jgi:uncharacterized SAM-binding protein YcdF (DUF218 family)
VACIVPPGILIVLCLVLAFFAKKKMRLFLILFACVIYALSIAPTAKLFIAPLEKGYTIPSVDTIRQCDAYVVLGGGTNEEEPTLDGKGMPLGDALSRVMGAYRVYLLFPKPIIISGGGPFGREPEADITKRFLISLGVKEKDIIAESKSQDTFENARFTRDICTEKRFGKILLFTNAYHMSRSSLLFRKHFVDFVPYPTGFRNLYGSYGFFSFLPEVSSMAVIALAAKEYLGILFYRITL